MRLLDAREHVGDQGILAVRVDDAVGRDVGDAHLARQAHQLLVALRLLCGEMVLQFEIETLAEDARATRRCAARDRAPNAAGERDQPVAAAVEILESQARVALAAAHLRARDQLAEIRVAALVFDQEHETRAVFEASARCR